MLVRLETRLVADGPHLVGSRNERSSGGLGLDSSKAGSLPSAPLFGSFQRLPSDTYKYPMVGKTSSQLIVNQNRLSTLHARCRHSVNAGYYQSTAYILRPSL
jgi:hypothetical protein